MKAFLLQGTSMLKALFTLTIVLWSQGLCAEPILTATCDDPKGPRIDYGETSIDSRERKFEIGNDSFTGVHPSFIIDDEMPNMLTVLWGNTRLNIPESFARPPKANQYPIVHLSHDQISAIASNSNEVWVYSLYPKLGYGIFSRHSHYNGLKHLIANTFYSKCRFAQ